MDPTNQPAGTGAAASSIECRDSPITRAAESTTLLVPPSSFLRKVKSLDCIRRPSIAASSSSRTNPPHGGNNQPPSPRCKTLEEDEERTDGGAERASSVASRFSRSANR